MVESSRNQAEFQVVAREEVTTKHRQLRFRSPPRSLQQWWATPPVQVAGPQALLAASAAVVVAQLVREAEMVEAMVEPTSTDRLKSAERLETQTIAGLRGTDPTDCIDTAVLPPDCVPYEQDRGISERPGRPLLMTWTSHPCYSDRLPWQY